MKFSAFSFNANNLLLDYLIVGGGSYGQNSDSNQAGKGGGAGGFISGSDFINFGTSYTILVGAGGIAQTATNAGSSSFNNLIAGGGNGAESGFPQSHGFSPDVNCIPGNYINKSGGAGAGQTGSAALCSPFNLGGAGGNGLAWLDGNYYAGGGGAGVNNLNPGVGGLGGGGTGGNNSPVTNPTTGSKNTGGGGGGAYKGESIIGANGGDGIVIIRYPGTGSQAIGGTISYSGSFTYHTFTASATLFT